MVSGDITKELAQVAAALEVAALAFRERRFTDAEPAYKYALDVLQRLYGDGDPDTIACLQSLGDLYYASGRYREALPMYEKLLSVGESILGRDHPGVVQMVMRLASTKERLGQSSEAEDLFRRADRITTGLAPIEDAPTVKSNSSDVMNVAQRPVRGEFVPETSGKWNVLGDRKVVGLTDSNIDVEELERIAPPHPSQTFSSAGAVSKSSASRLNTRIRPEPGAGPGLLLFTLQKWGLLIGGGSVALLAIAFIAINAIKAGPPKIDPALVTGKALSSKTKVTFFAPGSDVRLTVYGGTKATYEESHETYSGTVEAVGPGLFDFARAVIGPMSAKRLWYTLDAGHLTRDDNMYLYDEHSGEAQVIAEMGRIKEKARTWFDANATYPENDRDFADLAYRNPFSNVKAQVPQVLQVAASRPDASDLSTTESTGSVNKILEVASTGLWINEPSARPGEIHILTATKDFDGKKTYMFFMHGFDRNGDLIRGHKPNSVFLVEFDNGISLTPPSGGLQERSTPQPLSVHIADMSAIKAPLWVGHYLLALALAAAGLSAFGWAALSRGSGTTGSGLSTTISMLGAVCLVLAITSFFLLK